MKAIGIGLIVYGFALLIVGKYIPTKEYETTNQQPKGNIKVINSYKVLYEYNVINGDTIPIDTVYVKLQ